MSHRGPTRGHHDGPFRDSAHQAKSTAMATAQARAHSARGAAWKKLDSAGTVWSGVDSWHMELSLSANSHSACRRAGSRQCRSGEAVRGRGTFRGVDGLATGEIHRSAGSYRDPRRSGDSIAVIRVPV